MRRTLTIPLAVLAPLLGACGDDQPVPESFVRAEAWDGETLELAGTLPVQSGGRVKPLDTFAGFQLLEFNGKRSLKLPGGEKLTRTGFLLDCLFFPEQAKDYPCFLVQNSDALDAIGVESKKLRAHYTYRDLLPGRARLFSEAGHIAGLEAENRDTVQRQVLALAGAVRDFEALTQTFEFARSEVATEGLIAEVVGQARPGVSHIVPHIAEIRDRVPRVPDDQSALELQRFEAVAGALQDLVYLGQNGPAFFPPETTATQRETWLNASDVIYQSFVAEVPTALSIGWLRRIEAMQVARNDRETFRAELTGLLAGTRGEAQRRGEYGKIASEVALYRANPFGNALVLYLLGFVLVSLSWLFTRRRWLRWGTWGTSLAGTALVVVGVTWRCYLRERPPVVNLYDTILFITGVAGIACMVMEAINRKRIGLSLTPMLGALGMFLALRYEVKDAALNGDTMTAVIAVLDTNFWLATHVTSITAGYSAGLMAAAISMVWIVCRLLGVRRGDKAFYRDITKMTYGALCFGLLFSVVGTILGGVWANESWGRFWGWDPKENGALLICLTQIITLHLRMGGYIKEYGLHAMVSFGGAVVAFSWWGVNLLNSGLHSYGFTDGIFRALVAFVAIQALMVVACGVLKLMDQARAGG